MPLFQYTALDTSSKKYSGVIEAEHEKDAKAKLRERGLLVSSLSNQVKLSRKETIRPSELLRFTEQLAQLVNAGVPLYESLVTIEEQNDTEKTHRIYLSLCEQVKGGKSLSEAMSTYPASFYKLYIGMVAAGEASGSLGMVLTQLATFLKKEQKLKKEVTNALIYPGILAFFSLLVIMVLLGFVVPSIEGIFEGRELNIFTRSILALSYFFRNYWFLYIPVIAAIGFFLYWQFTTKKGKERIERLLMSLPIVRKLLIEGAVARFSMTMGTLLKGGVTFVDALAYAREVMNNQQMEKEIVQAEARILEGGVLSQELKNSPTFPPLIYRMLAIGEETGEAAKMFLNLAEIYEDSLEKNLSRLVALAQPLILIIMGGVIGLVMVAILLPLSDIASFTT